MTEEMSDSIMHEDHEEGEILEDGEIADDEDDITGPIGGSQNTNQTPSNVKDEKENKESNKFKYDNFNSVFPTDREDFFKSHKRRKRGNSKKNKRSNSIESKKKFSNNDSVTNHELIDISHRLNDTFFDNVELSDEDEYNYDLLDFDVLMQILGCTVDKSFIDNVASDEKRKIMVRIMKIMKNIHGNEPATARRFARLKRRTRDRQNSQSSGTTQATSSNNKAVFKAVCKFYLEGKCHKGSDCYFSHDCPIPKRKELCKFYLQGFCGKGDDCLFMHGEFPCKFFHTNTECYAGEKCRFSHAPLTEETRAILRNYLDSGTLPDDPKPFRPHFSNDWSNSSTSKTDDLNDVDSSEFDSSFNYETEQLLSKPRPVILGEPTNRLKTCYSTWKWQQELKELEKAYTGLKKNLFCIDDIFAINEKPPSPRIEDDEEEIEAQIRNYYNDLLDTDDYDEMISIQEIEEHQRRVEEESQNQTVAQPEPNFIPEEISEEEKRLIEASALDEDLRILPPAMMVGGGQFPNVIPPPVTIPPIFDSINYNSTNNYYSPPDQFSTYNPNTFIGSTEIENSNPDLNYNESNSSFIKSPPPEINSNDVTNMVRQIRNGSISEPSSNPPINTVPLKSEFRDPRLNRMKESNRNALSNTLSNNIPSVSAIEEKPLNKPFIKICNPNVIIDYKLVLIKVFKINYTSYYDLYQNDNILKNDPRLKKYFSCTNNDQKVNSETDYLYSKINTSPTDNLLTLPSLNIPSMNKLPSIIKPPMPTKILSPLEIISKSENESPPVTRDPRMKSKDVDLRSSSSSLNTKSSDLTIDNVSVDNGQSVSSDELSTKSANDISISSSSSITTTNTSTTTTSANNNLNSIPSYAIAALPSNNSFYGAVTNNLFYSSFNSSEKVTDDKANDKQDHNENSNNKTINGSLENNTLADDNSLKDNNISNDCDLSLFNDNYEKLNIWPININSNTIDSDNEMEIDLQHHNESEVDSENENELIIASSSEPEDNKDCDSQSTLNSINC